MSITGTLYLMGEKGSSKKKIVLEEVRFNKESSKKMQISKVIKSVNPNYSFEKIKDRGSSIQTRPTTRDFYNFVKQEDGSFSIYEVKPNFLSRVIEVHKGHGPGLLKNLQKVLGVCLTLIIITGFFMSMKIQKRVKSFLVTMGIGTIFLASLFFL